VKPAKRCNGVVIVTGDEAKRQRVMRRTLNRPAVENLGGIAQQQPNHQHRRMVRNPTRSSVLLEQFRQIQPVNHLDSEARQVSLWPPFINRRWPQQSDVAIDWLKVVPTSTDLRELA
jgi:hypothetical protein